MDLTLASSAPATGHGPATGAALPPLWVGWARHQDEVRAAQRLRHRVFVDEMGARPTLTADAPPGHDCDAFDAHCEQIGRAHV
jgi:putative hemolysin